MQFTELYFIHYFIRLSQPHCGVRRVGISILTQVKIHKETEAQFPSTVSGEQGLTSMAYAAPGSPHCLMVSKWLANHQSLSHLLPET